MVGDLAAFGQDGRDDQIFGPRVGRALIDEQGLLPQPGGGHRQGRLADPRCAREPRRQRQVPRVDDQPARQQLTQNRVLSDPVLVAQIRRAETERHSTHLDQLDFALNRCGLASHDEDVNPGVD